MDHDLASIAAKPMIAGPRAAGRASTEGSESAFAARVVAGATVAAAAASEPRGAEVDVTSDADGAEVAQEEATRDGAVDISDSSDADPASLPQAELTAAPSAKVLPMQSGGSDAHQSVAVSRHDDLHFQDSPTEHETSGFLPDRDRPAASEKSVLESGMAAPALAASEDAPEAIRGAGRKRPLAAHLLRPEGHASEGLPAGAPSQTKASAADGPEQLPFDADLPHKPGDLRKSEPSVATQAALPPSRPPMTGREFASGLAASLGEQALTADRAQAGEGADAWALPSGLLSSAASPTVAAGAFASAPGWAGTSADAVRQQLADAILSFHGDRTEIALSPEELGSLRLVLSKGDGAPTLTVWVERPEVLEMLRRNSDALLADLQEAGLAGSGLEFRDGSDWRGASGDRASSDKDAVTRLTLGRDGHGGDLAGRDGQGRAMPGSHEGGRLDIRV